MTSKESAKELVIFHKDEDFIEGKYLDALLLASKFHYRKCAFAAHNVLKNMDYAGVILSYRRLEALRSIEREYFDGSKGHHTIIPSIDSIQCCAKKVKALGNKTRPFKTMSTQFGEGIEFDYKSRMDLL